MNAGGDSEKKGKRKAVLKTDDTILNKKIKVKTTKTKEVKIKTESKEIVKRESKKKDSTTLHQVQENIKQDAPEEEKEKPTRKQTKQKGTGTKARRTVQNESSEKVSKEKNTTLHPVQENIKQEAPVEDIEKPTSKSVKQKGSGTKSRKTVQSEACEKVSKEKNSTALHPMQENIKQEAPVEEIEKPTSKPVKQKGSGTESRKTVQSKASKEKNSAAPHPVQENIKQEAPSEEIKKPTRKQLKQKGSGTKARKTIQSEASEKGNSGSKVKKFVGAHLSISGGLEHAIHGAKEIGAQAVGLFLKSQRTWNSKPLEENTVQKFKKACEEHQFPMTMILPHGSYLLNCGSPKDELLAKSRDNLIDDLLRCDRLGIKLFNFHPGSTCGEISIEECIRRIAESINIAHSKTQYVTVVIENMSCQGHTIGGKFEEIRDIISLVEDKERIGVCLDTCHAFAAGFDFRTETGYNQMISDFEKIIGLQYLKAIHLNDSKGDVGCHMDRHENIGKGKIGLKGFRHVMHDERLNNIPMILETPPTEDDSDEIELLYSL